MAAAIVNSNRIIDGLHDKTISHCEALIRRLLLGVRAVESRSGRDRLQKLVEPGETAERPATKRSACRFGHVTGGQAGEAVVAGNARNVKIDFLFCLILHPANQSRIRAAGKSSGAGQRQ